MSQIDHPLVVVLSQDCDLFQDYRTRGATIGAEGTLDNILFCDLHDAANLRQRLREREKLGREDWKKIGENQSPRFQYLQRVATVDDLAGKGLAPQVVDFRMHFTLRTAEVYKRLESGALRRCRLATPYVEHLSHRFYSFLARVALEANHIVEPTT